MARGIQGFRQYRALVFAGALIGGALSAPTSKATPPELLLQPPNSNVAPVDYISRHHAQDELGQVNYGFSHPGQAKNEQRDSSGNVAGAYSYTDADNKVVIVEYTAGENGFQVRSNNLPIAVSDTPEVLAAKLQFVEQYNAAALAAAAAQNENKDFPVGDSSPSDTAIPVQVSSSPVRDTPEVIAAKLQFVEAYNTAALAAANAPDDPVVISKTEFRSKASTYPNPTKDTQEVIAAKLQFVEAYNAAALAAAKTAENPQANNSQKITIVYGLPVVQDTPEVLAAKLKFVEDYNAAAISAALAPDDKSHEVATNLAFSTTEEPSEEPVTELGVIGEQTLETTLSPRSKDKDPELTTLFPVQKEKGKETTKKIYQLTPIKVGGFSDERHEELHDKSSVAVESKPATDFSLYKYSYSNSGVNVPQAHSYGVGVTQKPVIVDAPIAKTSVLPNPVSLPSSGDQTIAVPVTQINRHHSQDETGQVNYGYSYPGQAQNEVRDASGNVEGVYTYVDEENKVIRVEYTAGKDGFNVKSNNLPIAAQDTPDVLAAKLQFVEAYNTAAIAAANAPDDPVKSEDSTSVPFIHPNTVKDTPEVVAAKLQFVEAYNAAALPAANAPDDPVEFNAPQQDKAAPFVDPYPIRDTPEVIGAKLQFVETYNAAALSAAGATNEAGKEDIPKATLAYTLHPVKDTPEVIAAKLQFVEVYNAAALAAAIAPDDEIQKDETGEARTYTAPQPVLATGESVDIPAVIPTSLQVPSVEVPATYVSRHHAQDEHGQVNYGFSHPGQAKNEVRDANGQVAGAYSYVDSDDQVVRVRYTAGEDGFQVVSNNLPIAPIDTPEVLAAKLQFVEAYNAASLAAAEAPDDVESESSISSGDAFVVPSPVKDTPEVLAAKLQFVEAYNAAALAAAEAPDDVESESYISSGGTVVVPSPVKDTPEVLNAKLQFVEAYNAAALAAANAPDDPSDVYPVDGKPVDPNPVRDNPEVTEDTPNLTANTIIAPHPVKDTPEVIAAKIAFVKAYNAAALAAALAPDDDVMYDTAEEPSEYEAVTVLGERSTEESVADTVAEKNNSENLVAIDLPEVSQPLDNLVKTSQIVEPVVPRTSVEYQSFLGPFARYAGYLPGADGTAPTMYTYSIPHGLYGLHPSTTSVKGFPFSVHFVPTQFVQQDPGQTNNHVTIYSPSHGY
ncbi:uncharacterized protein [Palaemon carinicauda]|uniref:uncharacterized protein isoform X2 n=1 Tax=Palaemon carinicauda TaxID=392227 RepID=UPI0035B57A80